MKRLFGGACVLVFAMLGQANAGDFKGFYAGANVGGVSSSSDAATTTVFSPTGYFAPSSVPAIATVGAQKLGSNGFTGGGEAGFNLQHNAFVIGVEADFGGMKLDKIATGTAPYPCCPTTNFTVRQALSTSWLITARPRVGFAAGPLLIYGTGGLAVTSVDYTALFTDTFASANELGGKNGSQTGWAAGGGAEFKTGKHWSMKAELLHADFGSQSVTSTNLHAPATTAWPTNVFTHKENLSGNLYRFGFNFYL
ncbi:MAG TPA: outer membrane beta-barrel protein [Candidatus Angelobacter sp.]|nr:outer membrane beta-barrel protein [Candidatus Angelobacter sp.]